LPRSLAAATLADEQPTAFAPADFAAEDFRIDMIASDGTAVEARLVRDSLRWVRVAHVIVAPRALLSLRIPGAAAGLCTYLGFSQPMAVADGAASAEIPVVLFSGANNPIRVRFRSGGAEHDAAFAIRFAPRDTARPRVLFDASCSPYALRVEHGGIADDAFAYIGCRGIRTAHEDGTTATLELYVLWDRAEQPVAINGIATEPRIDSLFTYRVAAAPNHVRLRARGRELVLGYSVPERMRAGFIGAGLGPYYYSFRDATHSLQAPAAMATLYAGYAFTATTRIVYFNAAVLHRLGSMDQGLYVWLEQFRIFDERVSMNLLLGANLLVYARHDSYTVRVSAPQGVELITRDVLGRGKNLTLGAFIYPKINDRSYYNMWLRWGSQEMFGEVNYIEWQEPHADGASRSRALGLSFGAAVLRFL
jgi:hypothetical protein